MGRITRPSVRSDVRKTTTKKAHRKSKRSTNTKVIRRNDNGGVLVTQKDVHTVFSLLGAEEGTLHIDQAHESLNHLRFNISQRDAKFFMNNKMSLEEEELYEMLRDNQLTDLDPVAEAFNLVDPFETGYVDIGVLKAMLKDIGAEYLNDDDMAVLIREMDRDGDGKIRYVPHVFVCIDVWCGVDQASHSEFPLSLSFSFHLLSLSLAVSH